MDKVLGGVLVKGIPTELVRDLVELGGPEMGSLGDGEGNKVLVGAGGKDAVEPGLLVFVAGGGEGGAGEFFGVEAKGGFLWGVAEGRQGT